MLLGFASFAERPFSTVDDDNDVTIQVTGNALQISIGNINVIAGTIVEIPNPNRLTLGTGTVTISGSAAFAVTGNATTLSVGTVVASGGATATTTGNALTLATGNVTVTGNALINPAGSQLVVGTGELGVITWNDIIPGVDMTWTEIEPY